MTGVRTLSFRDILYRTAPHFHCLSGMQLAYHLPAACAILVPGLRGKVWQAGWLGAVPGKRKLNVDRLDKQDKGNDVCSLCAKTYTSGFSGRVK